MSLFSALHQLSNTRTFFITRFPTNTWLLAQFDQQTYNTCLLWKFYKGNGILFHLFCANKMRPMLSYSNSFVFKLSSNGTAIQHTICMKKEIISALTIFIYSDQRSISVTLKFFFHHSLIY